MTEVINETTGEKGEQHDLVEKMALTGEVDPHSAADIVIRHLLRKGSEHFASLNDDYSDKNI